VATIQIVDNCVTLARSYSYGENRPLNAVEVWIKEWLDDAKSEMIPAETYPGE
jgi:hypothetical protein